MCQTLENSFVSQTVYYLRIDKEIIISSDKNISNRLTFWRDTEVIFGTWVYLHTYILVIKYTIT